MWETCMGSQPQSLTRTTQQPTKWDLKTYQVTPNKLDLNKKQVRKGFGIDNESETRI